MKVFVALALIAIVAFTEARPRRDLKSDLIAHGNTLLKQADEAVTKLSADTTKAHEVTVIKTEEARLKKIIADLEAATDDAKVRTIEAELRRAELQLQFEIQKVNHSISILPTPIIVKPIISLPVEPVHTQVSRDLKSDLTTKAQALLKKADDEIKKLSADTTKAHEVTVLKTEEAHIKKLLADLDATTDEAKLKTVEHNLTTADLKLQTELAKLNGTPAETKTTKAHVDATTKAPATF